MLDWVWRLCNMAFKSSVYLKDGDLYKGKGERTKWKNYRGISLSVIGKICSGILVDSL